MSLDYLLSKCEFFSFISFIFNSKALSCFEKLCRNLVEKRETSKGSYLDCNLEDPEAYVQKGVQKSEAKTRVSQRIS